MLFDSWTGLGRVVLVGALAYVALVLLLRISGKRTLSKLNAFDLVVTVALGSTLATVLLSKSVALAEGVLALGLLIFLQYAVGIRLGRRSDQVAVEAEDALIAALKVKTAHPEAAITYVRKRNVRGDRRHPHASQIDEDLATGRANVSGPTT